MIDRKISIRYARALDGICEDKNIKHRDMLNSLKYIDGVIKHNPDIDEFLKMSIVPLNKKLNVINDVISKEHTSYLKQFLPDAIIERIFSDNVKTYAKKFMEYIILKNRYILFEEIVDIFEEIVDERENIAKADVVSAIELNEETKKELKDYLESKFNKTIELNFSVDKDLIAGIIVKMDDVVYDGSINTYLNNLERRLLRLSL